MMYMVDHNEKKVFLLGHVKQPASPLGSLVLSEKVSQTLNFSGAQKNQDAGNTHKECRSPGEGVST